MGTMENMGYFRGFYGDAYHFQNGTLDLLIETDSFDPWVKSNVKGKRNKTFDEKSYERRTLERMVNVNIEKVMIETSSTDEKDIGIVTIIGSGYFNEQIFVHEHDGYYQSKFRYRWEIESNDESNDESPEEQNKNRHIITDVGTFNSYDECGTYHFDNGDLDIIVERGHGIHWRTRDKDGDDHLVFNNEIYHRLTLKQMIGFEIKYVIIDIHEESDVGIITIISNSYFNEHEFFNDHNGYYPASFGYFWNRDTSESDTDSE